ncbi:MAG: glycerophosphodiester phosphodiesterase family protein [Bacteroidales bacterium]|nr:glycerophosphodiester phosphodiesterase family protein [Bacteroidales bacterium]
MKRILIIVCLVFLSITSCKKEVFDIENLNGNRITALGHAGMGVGNTYPMDSYESIVKCLNLGMDGSEFDVQMTKDSVLVLFHDMNFSERTNLKGTVNSLNWNEIKNAHYSQTLYLDYSIISMEQLFSNVENLQKYKFTFDCKMDADITDANRFYESFINAIVKIVQKYKIENNIYIEAQDVGFLTRFKNKYTDYKLFIYPSSFESGLNTALSLNLSGITISTRDITKEQIKIAHDNNLWVAIWNTHTNEDNMDAINKNPDFIQTDNVRNLVSLLK